VGYDIIIVGAGASGLLAAISAARQGSSVLVIEHKDKAGKKILATGNGRCNYTNLYQNPECYRSDDSAFVMKVLSCFDASKTITFFKELGIYPKEKNGYLYPNSEQASSVLQVLLMECRRLKVNFVYEEKVVQIKRPNYTVITEKLVCNDNNKATMNSGANKAKKQNSNAKVSNSQNIVFQQTYFAEKLILATGGCASPQLGSDGSGYRLAELFGHTIIKPLPALVQLKSNDKYCKTLAGVRTLAKVTAYSNSTELATEEGELLFTDYGISGIPIMQISRFVAKALDKGDKTHLMMDFLPELSMEELNATLLTRLVQNPAKTTEELLVGLLNHKLNYIIIVEAKLDPYKVAGKLTPKEIDAIIQQIKKFRMNITDTNSFEQAQVSAGGVTTKEIHEKTMESKLSNNLYLIGELLDVDGTCGGYNLQWAWSSGYLAGLAAGNRGEL
jgi:predicted Rossmann fold flavoprotein